MTTKNKDIIVRFTTLYHKKGDMLKYEGYDGVLRDAKVVKIYGLSFWKILSNWLFNTDYKQYVVKVKIRLV